MVGALGVEMFHLTVDGDEKSLESACEVEGYSIEMVTLHIEGDPELSLDALEVPAVDRPSTGDYLHPTVGGRTGLTPTETWYSWSAASVGRNQRRLKDGAGAETRCERGSALPDLVLCLRKSSG